MNPELAQWLVSAAAEPALARAMSEPDPDSLAAATRLRRAWSGEQAAALLTQVALRRRAVAKFGENAQRMFFTPVGLEQATRAEVATWRASRFVAAGVRKVVDLGCGLGADALAFAAAGLQVIGVEADPVTATFAQANLGPAVEVRNRDAVELAAELLQPGVGFFIDPARRGSTGRSWRVSDFSPSWDFALRLFTERFGCIKASPGLPASLIPPGRGVSWVSQRGDLVETTIWPDGPRGALLLPGGDWLESDGEPEVGELGRWLYEPDAAVIRARAVGRLAFKLGAVALAPGIAYLTGSQYHPTPFATAFEVLEDFAWDERRLRTWAREHRIGILEIKVRGLDVDPAVLRRRLKLSGKTSATVVLTPSRAGSRLLVVRRVPRL